jgi:hypothetical protein
MVEIISPFVDVPPVDFWQQLLKLNQKRKILFMPPPITQMVRNPIKFQHCFICNRNVASLPYFALSVCDKCYKNKTNIDEFKNNTMVSSYDTCNICGKFFTVGVVVLNVPLCDFCRVYTTNVVRRAFGVQPIKMAF